MLRSVSIVVLFTVNIHSIAYEESKTNTFDSPPHGNLSLNLTDQISGHPTKKPQVIGKKTLPNFGRCGVSLSRHQTPIPEYSVKLGDWPWIAAIYTQNNQTGRKSLRCSGSLIAQEWVLLAAHCIPTSSGKEKLSHVRLGDLDLNDLIADKANPIDVDIKVAIIHSNFSLKPFVNDIALLRLSKPVEFNEYIRPTCLHTEEKYVNETYYDKKRPFIIGWSAEPDNFTKEQFNPLLEENIKMIPLSECKSAYDQFLKTKQLQIDKTVICASGFNRDVCEIEFGGPLMFRENQSWYQGGISFPRGCLAGRMYPNIYTRVAAFADWINITTGIR